MSKTSTCDSCGKCSPDHYFKMGTKVLCRACVCEPDATPAPPMPGVNPTRPFPPPPKMNLYHIQFDCQSYYVEAERFGDAIEAWKRHVAELWGEDCDGTEQPESVALVHDEAVIRG